MAQRRFGGKAVMREPLECSVIFQSVLMQQIWCQGSGSDAKEKHTSDQRVNPLRQIEAAVANGKTAALAYKEAERTGQRYYRSRKEYGGLHVDQARRLKQLELENSKLKRLVSELSPEKSILKDIVSGNFKA